MKHNSIYDEEALKEIASHDFDEKIFSTSLSMNALSLLIKRAVDISFKTQMDVLKIMSQPEENKLLSIEEAAELFGVSMVTIHTWKREGKLKGFKRMGGRVYIHENDCLASMKEIKLKGKKG